MKYIQMHGFSGGNPLMVTHPFMICGGILRLLQGNTHTHTQKPCHSYAQPYPNFQDQSRF